MDGRTVLRMDVAFHMGTTLWALLESLCGTHVLLAYQNTDRISIMVPVQEFCLSDHSRYIHTYVCTRSDGFLIIVI